jgi:hypothetical protein
MRRFGIDDAKTPPMSRKKKSSTVAQQTPVFF